MIVLQIPQRDQALLPLRMQWWIHSVAGVLTSGRIGAFQLSFGLAHNLFRLYRLVHRNVGALQPSIETQWFFRTIKQVIFLRQNKMFSKTITWWKQIAGVFGRGFLDELRTCLSCCLFLLINIPCACPVSVFPPLLFLF